MQIKRQSTLSRKHPNDKQLSQLTRMELQYQKHANKEHAKMHSQYTLNKYCLSSQRKICEQLSTELVFKNALCSLRKLPCKTYMFVVFFIQHFGSIIGQSSTMSSLPETPSLSSKKDKKQLFHIYIHFKKNYIYLYIKNIANGIFCTNSKQFLCLCVYR